MKPEFTTSYVVQGLPNWISQKSLEKFVQQFFGITQVRYRPSQYPRWKFDLILDFEPGVHGLKILGVDANENFLTIDHQDFRIAPLIPSYPLKDVKTASTFITQLPPPSLSREIMPYKLLKLNKLDIEKSECYICRAEIEGLFSTPCWLCRNSECYDCITHHFHEALANFERFPAACCDIAFHPDVAKGILPDREHAKYKSRFEEWLAKQPIYCPSPTCSAFIPLRLLKAVIDNSFNCPACELPICIKCKQPSHIGKLCAEAKDNGTLDIMKKFGYKQCPRCGIAVGKMFGCSHMRCNCGAHWCWDCRRRIEICNLKPCDAVRNGEIMDYEDLYDRESDIDSIGDHNPDSAASPAMAGSRDENVEEEANGINSLVPTTNLPASLAPDTKGCEASYTERLADGNAQDSGPYADLLTTSESSQTQTTSNFMSQNDTMQGNNHGILPPPSSVTPILEASNLFIQTFRPLSSVPSVVITENADTTTNTDSEQKPANLDDPYSVAWEAEGLFFGEEPSDEDTLDVWGCTHRFEPATYNRVPRYWMTASVPDWWERDISEREIACMVCWRPTKIAPKPSEIESMIDEMEKRKIIKDWRYARRCVRCNIIVCRRCRNDLTRKDA